jgi:Family of unknown function (DUF6065)/Cupin-like domain
MSESLEVDNDYESPSPAARQLELTIYQIIDDAMLKQNRADGTGWDWSWANWQRDWMDASPSRFAYRCLPLTIANQTGLWIKNPVGFTATWLGPERPGSIDFQFDRSADVWRTWITNEFGLGIITWNTPFLFRTKPQGSRLLVCGPANEFKANAHPLTAIIESDWITMSFTMNWKIMNVGEPVRFEMGEPLFQAIPLLSNACADLEGASVTYKKLDDDPDVARAYREWDQSRVRFMERSKAGGVKPDEWQRDYFLGRDASGRQVAPVHMTKVKPPYVRYEGSAALANPGHGARDLNMPGSGSDRVARQGPLHSRTGKARRPVRPQPITKPNATTRNLDHKARAFRPVTDEWRRWIAENLMLGASRESILNMMVDGGLSPSESASEIELAFQSPYLRGAERLCNRLSKREWLLGAYRKLNRLRTSSGEIERKHRLSRSEFLDRYYSAGRPVIITGVMDDWPALKKWGIEYFLRKFGSRAVEVQVGRNASDNYEAGRDQFRQTMLFSEFLERVSTAGKTNDIYITASNNSANKAVLPELWDDIVQFPEYLDANSLQNGFLWFGPAGTITPFHHDLTNNFMAQVIGRKRILLAPSWDIPFMKNLTHVYCEIDGRATPPAPRPGFYEPQILECILNPGEVLFLPVGSMHFVEALEISATVAFTNFSFDDNDYTSFYKTYQGV